MGLRFAKDEKKTIGGRLRATRPEAEAGFHHFPFYCFRLYHLAVAGLAARKWVFCPLIENEDAAGWG